MARREVVVVVCDGCGRTDDEVGIRSHRVKVDGRNTKQVDACADCWEQAMGPMGRLLAAGR